MISGGISPHCEGGGGEQKAMHWPPCTLKEAYTGAFNTSGPCDIAIRKISDDHMIYLLPNV
jgi:hypothetical protein